MFLHSNKTCMEHIVYGYKLNPETLEEIQMEVTPSQSDGSSGMEECTTFQLISENERMVLEADENADMSDDSHRSSSGLEFHKC